MVNDSTSPPLTPLIGANIQRIGEVDDTFWNGKPISDAVVDFLLTDESRPKYDARPEWWSEHEEAFQEILIDNAGEEYREFDKKRREVFNFSNKVLGAIREVRRNLEREFGIRRDG